MITRTGFARQWGVHDHGITVAPEVHPERPPLQRGGRIPLGLAPLHVAMDPSDPKTWRKPVRFT